MRISEQHITGERDGGMTMFEEETGPGRIRLSEQIAELERELALRQLLYPRWIAAGSMAQATGEYQIAALKAAIRTLQSLVNDGK